MSPFFRTRATETVCHVAIGRLNQVHPLQQRLVGALLPRLPTGVGETEEPMG
jgi:hypothetical protein